MIYIELRGFKAKTVPKKSNWLIALIACAGIWSYATPVKSQALLPYTPKLDSEKLEQQGFALLQDAIQLLRFGEPELAISRAKLATQLIPDLYQPWFILGSLYTQEQENSQDAVVALEKAHSLAPEAEETNILFVLGSAYFQNEQYQKSVETLQQALQIEPDNAEALFNIGNSYLKLNRYTQAIASYEEAFQLDDQFWPAINNIGLVKYEEGNSSEAIQHWQQALEIDDDQAEPILAIAVAMYIRGDEEEGLNMGKAALSLDSRYAELEFLRINLWGDKLLDDTRVFFNTPEIRRLIATF